MNGYLISAIVILVLIAYSAIKALKSSQETNAKLTEQIKSLEEANAILKKELEIANTPVSATDAYDGLLSKTSDSK